MSTINAKLGLLGLLDQMKILNKKEFDAIYKQIECTYLTYPHKYSGRKWGNEQAVYLLRISHINKEKVKMDIGSQKGIQTPSTINE